MEKEWVKQFIYETADTGIEIRLKEAEKKFFTTSEKMIPAPDWSRSSSLTIARAVGLLHSVADEYPEKCHQLSTGDGYFLSHEFVASLSEIESRALNLPPTLPYELRIEDKNALGSSGYAIDWSLYGRNRPLRFERKGCLLMGHEKVYRLPSGFLNIIELIDQYNQSDSVGFDEKIAFVVELKSLLPEDIGSQSQISAGKQISEIKLRQASAFSLRVTGNKDSLNFEPVLFGRTEKERAASEDDLVEEDEQILHPDESRKFVESFEKSPAVKATYLLGRGSYVFVDRSLRPALEVVKKVVGSSLEERIEFARAPQKFIREALTEKIEGSTDLEIELKALDLDTLFVETRQYSDRVTGMGIWQEPELPWLKREPEEWRAGDYYHFSVEGKIVSIPSSDLEKSAEELRQAILEGRGKVAIGGEEIRPDNELLKHLEWLLTEKPDPDHSSPKPVQEEPAPSDRIVPLTKENFETIEFHKSLKPRSVKIKSGPIKCLSSRTELKEHQTIGIEWLVETYNRGYPGVLMADDMGLGKTLQALTFLAILVEAGKADNGRPVLVVAPVGLLKNWEEEHHKHLSGQVDKFTKIYGTGLKEFRSSKGRDIDSGLARLKTDDMKHHHWLLTTYETLRDYQVSFARMKFSCVVFDEIQKAKNPRSLISHGTKVLNRDFAIGLTGTPVENSLADLWTIKDILSPGLLEDLKTFVQDYPAPDPENPGPGLQKLRNLSDKLLKPVKLADKVYPPPMMRRMKSGLSDTTLPAKTLVPSEQTTLLMPDEQNKAYCDVSNKLERRGGLQ